MSPGGSAKNCADFEEARKICEKDGGQLPNLLRRRSEKNSVRVDCLRVVDGRNLLIFGVIDRWMFRLIPLGFRPECTGFYGFHFSIPFLVSIRCSPKRPEGSSAS